MLKPYGYGKSHSSQALVKNNHCNYSGARIQDPE